MTNRIHCVGHISHYCDPEKFHKLLGQFEEETPDCPWNLDAAETLAKPLERQGWQTSYVDARNKYLAGQEPSPWEATDEQVEAFFEQLDESDHIYRLENADQMYFNEVRQPNNFGLNGSNHSWNTGYPVVHQ